MKTAVTTLKLLTSQPAPGRKSFSTWLTPSMTHEASEDVAVYRSLMHGRVICAFMASRVLSFRRTLAWPGAGSRVHSFDVDTKDDTQVRAQA